MSDSTVISRRAQGPVHRVLADSIREIASHESTGEGEVFELSGPRDSGPPPHRHGWSEAYYVLDGRVEVQVDGRVTVLERGDYAFAPAQSAHAYRILSEEARMLVLTGSAGAGRFFASMDRAAAEPGFSMDRAVEVAMASGLSLALPPSA